MHVVTVVDQDGERASRQFEVLRTQRLSEHVSTLEQ
jgi:hypothetical protein